MKALTLIAVLSALLIQSCKPTVSKPEAIVIPFENVGDSFKAFMGFYDNDQRSSSPLFDYDLTLDIGTINLHGKSVEFPTHLIFNKSVNCNGKIGTSILLEPLISIKNNDTLIRAKGTMHICLTSRSSSLTESNGMSNSVMEFKEVDLKDDRIKLEFSKEYRKMVNNISLDLSFVVNYDSLQNISGISLISKEEKYPKLDKNYYYLGRMNNSDEKSTKIYLRQL